MNISRISGSSTSKTIYAGNLLMGKSGLKSTQEKMERQQKAAGQIDFWEKQKESLRGMNCDTLEEISRKLEMFHSYEDAIAAAKAEYNRDQMMHVLDEAEEMGEKIAEAAKKLEPKTPEERKEEMAEAALGKEDDGILEEMSEDLTDLQEELAAGTVEEITEEAAAEVREKLEETVQEKLEETAQERKEKILFREEDWKGPCRPFDARI